MNKYSEKTLVCFIIALLAISIDIIVADYCNLPSEIGFDMSRINIPAISMIITATVTISLFIFTYCMIQKWNLRKQENQAEIAREVLITTYTVCKNFIHLLDTESFYDLVSKKSDQSRKLIDVLKEAPFENESIITPFFHEGVISKAELVSYMYIKHEYSFFVGDIARMLEEKERKDRINKMNEYIDNALNELTTELKKKSNKPTE